MKYFISKRGPAHNVKLQSSVSPTLLMKFTLAVSVALVSALAFPVSAATTIRLPKTVTMAPMNDPWPAARERFWDIDNNPFDAWITNGAPNGQFSYANANVNLTFDRAPGAPYFVGRVQASGLKPNFAYQLKLIGKPQRGTRGWGAMGNDLSNERIGYAGRWWCDSSHATQTNFDDSHYVDFYKNAAPGTEHDIYGYQFMGDVVSDRFGNVNAAISGEIAYHITWASWQGGIQDVAFGTFSVQGGVQTSGFYGYGSTAPNGSVELFYEYEAGRPNPVVLPAGVYKCRFVLTEETFHNNYSSTPLGGYWKGVLATEDYDAQGNHDTNANNDVTFTIGARAPQIGAMTPQTATDAVNTPREFAVPYTDVNNDLQYVYWEAGNAKIGLQCLYSVPARKLYLRNAANTQWLGGFAPGSANIISNGRGQLNCAATQVENIASGIRVRWNVSAAPGWAGSPHRIYGFARDLMGLTVGWKSLGTWTISVPPQNLSLSPANGVSGAGDDYAVTSAHSDLKGAENIRYVLLHAGNPQSPPDALRGYYNAQQNKLYLLDDAGTSYLGGFAPGSQNVISNAQGSLDCASTSVSMSGDTLTVNWSLKPTKQWAFTSHDLWLYAIDLSGARTGWQKMGSWQIAG